MAKAYCIHALISAECTPALSNDSHSFLNGILHHIQTPCLRPWVRSCPRLRWARAPAWWPRWAKLGQWAAVAGAAEVGRALGLVAAAETTGTAGTATEAWAAFEAVD